MNRKSKIWLAATSLIILSMVLGACTPATPEPVEPAVTEVEVVVTQIVEGEPIIITVTPPPPEEPTPVPPVDRTGAWLDTVVFIEEPSADAAVTRLEVGDIDVYAYTVGNPEVAARVAASPAIKSVRSFGSYNELTFNPAGPVFEGTGKLNPFAVPRIREAMNILIDRSYITQEIMGGLGAPRWHGFNNASNDYAMLADVAKALEREYAYDFDRAYEIIAEEMEALGASLVGGTWQFEGEPVEIILLIRTEDERREIGDYVGNQLEEAGFVAVRDYKTSGEASPIWISGDPNDGLFHIYTGGWITTVVPRDLADNFEFFYTPRGIPWPLWLAYTPVPEFDEIAQRLDTADFTTLEERRELMARAMELALEDSVRIWLADRAAIAPMRNEVMIGADLYGSVAGSNIWSYTLKREGEIGGSMTVAMPGMLTEPWNPFDGSNWIYDMMLIRGSAERALNPDPYTGLWWPQRIERGEVIIQEGLPVGKTLDWVSLEFAPEIQVPDDAWVDWDAEEQVFITSGELYPEGRTALRKSTVYYEEDLFDKVKWHDGSSFSIADIVFNMITKFDRAKEESAIYDDAKLGPFGSFMATLRGIRIASEDPLVIETWSDYWTLDAELLVDTWWPSFTSLSFAQGTGGWHNTTLGIMAEAKELAAFSSAKAEELEVEWMSYIAGPTIEILAEQLEEAHEAGYIPYENTLGNYITAAEAQARWDNLANWYDARGHFWLGTGVYFLERAFPVEKTVIFRRFLDHPDPADKWDRFAEPMLAEIELDGPGRVTIGDEATFEVYVEFQGEPYLLDDLVGVKFILFDASGELAASGDAEAIEDGYFEVVLPADLTADLEAGSNLLEVVVISKMVAVPSADSMSFVTAD
ncbi:MAG: ABC transporter substrate-binding protein [Anaerolineales bacterium]